MEFDLRTFDETGPAGLLKKPWELDLSGEEWNARMTAEGLLNCLKAEETAKGLLRTNDMVMLIDSMMCAQGKESRSKGTGRERATSTSSPLRHWKLLATVGSGGYFQHDGPVPRLFTSLHCLCCFLDQSRNQSITSRF